MSNTRGREPDRPLRALAWMTLSALGFSTMTLVVKELSPEIPQFELVFARSFVNFMIQLGVVLYLGVSLFPPQRKLLVFRGLAGFGGVSCLFYAIAHLPVSVAAMLNWCSPVFVILFSALFLKETLSIWALGWIAVVFVGLIALLQPGFGASLLALPELPVAVGILGAAFGGMAYVAVRAATAKVGVNLIILYFTGIASLLSAPLAFRDFVVPSGPELLMLILVGVFASLGQFAMTQGYRFAKAGLVSTMGLINAGFTAIAGWAIFDERLSLAQWGGMLGIALGISMLSLGWRPVLYTPRQTRL